MESHINSLFNSVSYRVDNLLIDPGDEWYGFSNVSSVFLTHCHFDHIYGLNRIVELNPEMTIYTNLVGAEMLVNDKLNLSRYQESPFIFKYPGNIVIVKDGDIVKIKDEKENSINVEIYETPGHNPSCLTFIIEDNIFTGDAYIPGLKTVTNLPNSNKMDALKSINKIQMLTKGKTIRPGHFVDTSTLN